MSVIDDELLSGLFKGAGSAFTVPGSGISDILDRASGRPTVPEDDGAPAQLAGEDDAGNASWTRRLGTTMRSHRLLVGAACLVVAFVVAAGVGWIWKAPTAPRTTSVSPAAGTLPGSRSLKTTQPNSGFVGPGVAGTGAAAQAPTAGTTGEQPASGASGSSSSTANATGSSTGGTPAALPTGEVGQSSKIEQTGSLSLVVAKGATSKTMSELTFLAGTYSGFVVSSQTQAGAGEAGSTLRGSITLQVPVDAFATVLKKAQALGRTSTLTTKATDVTGQYVNLQSQITALQASLQQYLTIMTKATTIGEILSVQAQINTIQSQIQQLQGQLQVLGTETTYSTLTVLVDEKVPPVPVVPPRTQSGLAKAWHQGIHGFVGTLEGLIRLAGPALFVLAFAGAILLGVRFAWRRYRRAAL